MIQLEGKTMSVAMIVGPKNSKAPAHQVKESLKRLTHLHLENRRIEVIGNLELCTNLTHIYLHDNAIYTLVNDPFKGLANIT